MTVSSQTSTATFVGNGVATVFPLPFRFFNNSDVFAYFIDSVTGASTPMVLGIDYSLSGAGEPEVDGNALSTLTTAVPLASMRGLYVERIMPQVQETDIVNQGEFFASTHEDVFDRLTMLIQQSNANSEGAIRVAIGDPEPRRLPPAAQRINKLMTFDDTGEPSTEFYNPGDAAGLSILLADQTPGAEGARLVGYRTRTLQDRLEDMPSLKDYGAVWDGIADDTAAINAALAANAGKTVFFPAGEPLISDQINVPIDTSIYGAGVVSSNFKVSTSFNLAADGVIKVALGGQGQTLEGFGFRFTQPSTTVRASLTQYPPAINHAGVSRIRINNVRIRGAWDGIDATGNAGGADYGFIECGAYNVGLAIDGSLDTFNLGLFKFWPFGIVGTTSEPIFYDGTTIATNIGRCDGSSGEIHSFRALVNFIPGANSSAARGFNAIHLDGDGARLVVESGMLDVDYVYCTKSAVAALGPSIHIKTDAGTRVRITNLDLTSSETTNDCIRVDTGRLQLNGGRIRRIGTALRTFYLTAGSLSLRNVEMVAEGARSVAYVLADAGELIVKNCNWNTGGTGNAVSVSAAGVTGSVSGNYLNGRGLNIAIGSLFGAVDQRFSGTFSADAVTLAYLPIDWSVSKLGTGKYRITHNLGWNVNRTSFTFLGSSGAPTSGVTFVVDSSTTSTTFVDVWVYVSSVLTDVGTRFEVNHI